MENVSNIRKVQFTTRNISAAAGMRRDVITEGAERPFEMGPDKPGSPGYEYAFALRCHVSGQWSVVSRTSNSSEKVTVTFPKGSRFGTDRRLSGSRPLDIR